MPQHKIKRKVQLPHGVKASSGKISKKTAKKGVIAPKKGHHLEITPKNKQKLQQHMVDKEVTKVINADNEESFRQQAKSSGSLSAKK